MMAIWKGEIYCPRYRDLRPRPCPRPPIRPVLVEELNKEILHKYGDTNRCLVTTAQRMPDQRWLLDAISALN